MTELKAAQANGEWADFTNATVSGSLRRLDLRNADFSDANLKGVDFTGSDVTDTKFRDADLTEANLETVTGLIPEQLLGADLTRCKLPDGVNNFPQLENVREASKNAGAIFLTSMLACVFVLITVVSTGDMQLLSNTGTAQLPILNVAVGTSTFFTIAPVVLLALYVSVHLHLGRLWSMMATLPAVFPDGVPVEQKTYPWLLNDLVVFAFPRLKNQFRPQVVFYSLVAYLFVPVTVVTVWLRVLPKHDVNLSNAAAGFVAASAVAALGACWTHRRTMLAGRADRKWISVIVTPLALVLTAVGGILPFQVNRAVELGVPLDAIGEQERMLQDLGIYATANSDSWDKRFSERLNRAKDLLKDEPGRLDALEAQEKAALDAQAKLRRQFESNRWATAVLRWQPISAFGSIREDQTRFTKDWVEPKTPNFEPTPKEMAALLTRARNSYSKRITGLVQELRADGENKARLVPRISFARVGDMKRQHNLRFLDASYGFLVNSDFRGADLTGANFTGADLRGSAWWDDLARRGPTLTFAQMSGSFFAGANLSRADLTGANLYRATLSGVDLSGATLSSANLLEASLAGANLSRATLTGTNLSSAALFGTKMERATLSAANLSRANLTRAILRDATLTGADLSEATLTGASLARATITGANLTRANLDGAVLYNATLTGANLTSANFDGTDLTRANFTGAYWEDGFEPWFPSGYVLSATKLTFRKGDGSIGSYRVETFGNPEDLEREYIRLTNPSD